LTMRTEIKALQKKLGVTTVLVTHDQIEATTMADRIICMRAGRIEQIGTPEQVYLRPASTFVAGFIGSPPMNLLPGHVRGARFETGGVLLELPAPPPSAAALTMGVRPEHVQPDPAGPWPLRVEMIEMLGAERLLHGRLGSAAFTLRVDATLAAPRVGDTVPVRVPAEHLHWFDSASGQRA
ncbi:MAG: TOBE domain-containing protein, partial [Burkholderiales bacterium]|nr:TOBE domain-containing protein [Burkholderiales bacterium]